MTAKEIENKKLEIIKSFRPIHKNDVSQHIVRGQYESGKILDTPVAEL